MSESHHSHLPDPVDPTSSSAANWFTGWDSFTADDAPPADAPSTEDPSAPEQPAATPPLNTPAAAGAEDEWQPVGFPNAINMDAIERQWLYAEPPAPSPPLEQTRGSSHAAVRMEDISEGNAQPQVDELISLIQELNQCNNALLDRVSQLEETLERYQTQSPHPSSAPSQAMPLESALATADDEASPLSQVTQLTHELEFARQAHKRQEILVETLKGQLDNSQERVAQLERECALMQQKYNEQVQAVAQYENTCRDLRARLHRQQRYTMQFKVALEKSLEVPPPSYVAPDPLQADIHIPLWYETQTSLGQDLLPKIQRIQPWSSQSQSKFLEKLNLTALTEDASTLQPLPDTLSPVTPGADGDGESTEAEPLPVSYTIKAQSILPNAPHESAAELTDLDLAEDDIETLPEDIIKAGVAEFQSVLNSLWDEEVASSPEAAQVEEGLWKDLARLIDVSPDELVKASLANTFDAFTEPPGVSPSSPEGESGAVTVADLPIQTTDASDPDLATAPASPVPGDGEGKTASPFIANPNWPSPLVHPLRPARKLSSLAAVNLPRFAP